MLWAKVVLPIMMVLGGTAAGAAAFVADDAPAAGASQVWIDGPAPDSAFAPGAIAVSAHATASGDISALDLFVDGEKVATDEDLDQVERLVFATFEWGASELGEHELVVRQVGGSGDGSDPRFVTISKDAPEAPAPVTTTTLAPGETSTTLAPGETTTTTAETTTTVDASTTAPVTAPPTAPPPTAPATTTPPPAVSVRIDAASLASEYQNRLYVQGCGYVVQVSARIQNAEYADAAVRGTDVSVAMQKNGSTWTATLTSGAMFDAGDVGTHTVTVVAGRGDEVVDRDAGTVTIIQQCPKD